MPRPIKPAVPQTPDGNPSGSYPNLRDVVDGADIIRFTAGETDFDCITRAEAARRLGISLRTLHERTDPHGPIKPIRWGRRVLYSVKELDRYIRDVMNGCGSRTSDDNGGDR